jgi:undecaprenyl-diphosphatase
MNLIQTIILGIVEGVTEFLPISSTGHLILAARLLNLQQTDFLKSFEIAIQLGAILSIIFLYWKSFLVERKVLKKVIIAFIPTGILGFIFYKIFKQYLMQDSVVLWALFVGGIFLIIFELIYREKKNAKENISEISYKQAFLIGIFQSFAMISGVSRAAATIIGGLTLGLKRKTIVEFSFLLAVPTILAATIFDLSKNASDFSFSQLHFLIVGFIISFFVAALSVKFLLYFIKKYTFISFGAYRIILALLFWFLILKI